MGKFCVSDGGWQYITFFCNTDALAVTLSILKEKDLVCRLIVVICRINVSPLFIQELKLIL